MQVDVNGTRLWFDVEGPALVPRGNAMVERPTLVLVHGGPGSFDHSYFKPWFARLAERMQVVYLDLRGHGRSTWGDAATWNFEACADDVRAFCDALGLARPVVLGHSMGGFIAILYGSRHPGHAAGLILLSTFARFDLDRLVEGFRREAGDEVAALARRDYAGEEITDDEGERVFAAFGPRVPSNGGARSADQEPRGQPPRRAAADGAGSPGGAAEDHEPNAGVRWLEGSPDDDGR